MRRFLYILSMIFLFIPVASYSKEAVDLGFAPSGVWFSLDEFFCWRYGGYKDIFV